MSVKSYYNVRGQRRLEEQDLKVGSEAVPIELRRPYIVAENLFSKADGKVHFLDLCCGDGVHSILPAKLGHSVSGIDLSPKSIEAARWLAKKHQVSNSCNFTTDDALRFLEQNPNSFNWIFISGSLYYFDLELALPAIQKALKPGGHFICIGTNGSNPLANLYRTIKQKLTGYRDSATMNQLLRANDFAKLQRTFDRSQLQFFCFFSILGKIFPEKWGLRQKAVQALVKLDHYFLKIPGFWRLGFKFLLIAETRKPNEQ